MPNPDYSIERLADRAEIQDVMLRWCRAIDRLDFGAMDELFHPEAIDRHGMYEGGVAGLVEWLRERHRTISFSMHTIANMLIEFAAPDAAVVETYCLALQRHSPLATTSLAAISGIAGRGTATDVIACVRYVDRFERRNGSWRIGNRAVVWDYTISQEVPKSAPRMGDAFILGRRDGQDPVFVARAAAGLKD